ncbi:MAG: NmrA-like family protein [Clostridia bacterium]|nr:NmrA-like family protein [Clostridia bacterium]
MSDKNKIFITGATGNAGAATLQNLFSNASRTDVVAGVRHVDAARSFLNQFEGLEIRAFDFEKPETFATALQGVYCVFLMRPPHISKISKIMKPFLLAAREHGVKRIVFLSVQGADRNQMIPHSKIERLIRELNFEYIFLRPGYFMQNLTTTLYDDIRRKHKIILPAGNARFNWVDVLNIGEVAALLTSRFEEYKNQAIELTGPHNHDFHYVAHAISDILRQPVDYQNVGLISFYRLKMSEGVPRGKVLVMMMLHFLPRYQKELPLTDDFYRITGHQPTTMKEFLEREFKT